MNRVWITTACAAALATALASACDSDDEGSSLFDDAGARAGAGGRGASGNGGGAGTLLGDSSMNSGGTQAGTQGGPDGSCGVSTLDAGPRQVNMLLVIDKSGSMANTPLGFATDKWAALNTALQTSLNEAKNAIDFGADFFPFPKNPSQPLGLECGSRCCEMPASATLTLPIEDGPTGVPKILSLMSSTGPGGGTPTAFALDRALSYFKMGAGAQLKGDRFILLATDGGPNCNPALSCAADQCTVNLDGLCPVDAGVSNCCAGAASDTCLDDTSSIQKVAALAAAGVQTFVVGIPGTDVYRGTLNAMAEAGGRAQSGATKYFEVTAAGGVQGLTSVLQSIARQLITSCRLQLSSNPPDLGLLNVSIDGANVPQAGADGWDIDRSTSPPTIVLKGATCTRVETTGAQNVQVVYGCPTQGGPS